MEHRAQVDRLADEMERRLRVHDDDRGRDGWLGEPSTYLYHHLCDEIDELMNAIYHRDGAAKVWREAADVANFAMMMADNHLEVAAIYWHEKGNEK